MAANAPATQASIPRTMGLLACPLLGDVHVPDRLYADDVVLAVRVAAQMQQLLDVLSTF